MRKMNRRSRIKYQFGILRVRLKKTWISLY